MEDHTAGWYPDPGELHALRYWDGDRWTAEVSDAGVSTTAGGVRASWGTPGSGMRLAKRALVLLIVGVPVTTVLYVAWSLFVVQTAIDDAAYGWGAFAKNLPVVILMFVPPVLGFVWGVRACHLGEGKVGRPVIWVSGAALAWVLVVTDFGGIVHAAFGDTWDWTGFPLLVAKVGTALVVTLFALRAASSTAD